MTPASIDAVKRALRAAPLADLEREAQAALRDASATAVRARFAGTTARSTGGA
jgi:signal transduction protein with GAF and PtsI domain